MFPETLPKGQNAGTPAFHGHKDNQTDNAVRNLSAVLQDSAGSVVI